MERNGKRGLSRIVIAVILLILLLTVGAAAESGINSENGRDLTIQVMTAENQEHPLADIDDYDVPLAYDQSNAFSFEPRHAVMAGGLIVLAGAYLYVATQNRKQLRIMENNLKAEQIE